VTTRHGRRSQGGQGDMTPLFEVEDVMCLRLHSFLVKMYVQFGPFFVRTVSTLVLNTDLDIYFSPLSLRSFASLVLLQRTEVDKDRSGRGPKWL